MYSYYGNCTIICLLIILVFYIVKFKLNFVTDKRFPSHNVYMYAVICRRVNTFKKAALFDLFASVH